MNPRCRLSAAVLAGTAAACGLPLLGAWSAGAPIGEYLRFPPLTRPAAPAPFAWAAFAAVAAAVAASLALLTARAAESWKRGPAPPPAHAGRLPAWGWAAFAALAAAWALAWSRLPWMAPVQAHTFTPLWLAYTLAVNALCLRRTGRAPATHRPLFFLALFPASALFWWLFEFLNRFVRNWYYEGPALDAWAYVGWASLCFATVLPAVISTREWVASWGWVRRAFGNVRPMAAGGRAGWALAAAAAAGMFGVGRAPEFFFPLVWVAPLFIFAAALTAAGLPHPLAALRGTDWTAPAAAALAALICGFLWELWNFYSLARWRYAIPYLHRFALFEMPVLGYAGYPPFGLECALAAGVVDALLPRRRRRLPGAG